MEKMNPGYLRLEIDLSISDHYEVVIKGYFVSRGYRISVTPCHHEHGIAEGFGGDWYEWHWAVELADDGSGKLCMDILSGAFVDVEDKIQMYGQALWNKEG